MPRVVHFEISADDPERACAFYKAVFGWEIQRWDGREPYWLVTTGPQDEPGINGGVCIRKGPVGWVNTIQVPSIDEYLSKITAAGGTLAVPKMAIPGVGWQAYCQDTEGSVFGVHQGDPEAR